MHKTALHRILLFMLLILVGTAASAQGKSAPRLTDEEQKAYQLYTQGSYQQACEILLRTTHLRSAEHSSRIVYGLSVFFLVDIVGILFFLYIEKRKAYRLLVDKNADCAKRPVMNTAAIDFEGADVSDGKDRQILEALQRLFELDKVYLESDLTIEALAQRLGTSRNVLSKVVNHHLGRTFPALLNQYRINEAVRLLTEGKSQNYTIEAVAQMSGYNNRQVFYSAFKKETGITPTEFRSAAISKD